MSWQPERGQWVAQTEVSRPVVGKVRNVWPPDSDGVVVFDLVVYAADGEKLGRVSPPQGGSRTYEPCVSAEFYARIKEPDFPLELDLYGDWKEELEWLEK